MVIQPSFIPRLAITVDWFDITIDDAIQPIGAGRHPVDLRRDAGPAVLRPRQSRRSSARCGGPATASCATSTQNIGSFKTRGIDLGVSYAHEIGGCGNLSFNLVGTWLDELITDNGVSDPTIAPASTARPAALRAPNGGTRRA